jgi:nucleotide-binding universal stress UspA family protein
MNRENRKPFMLPHLEQSIEFASGTPSPAGQCDYPVRGVILYPTDFSELSRQAFEMACRIARVCGSRLIALHVAEPVRVSSLGMAPVPPLPKGYRGAWESRLRLLQPAEPDVRIEYRLEEGDAAAEILRVARETACDLIVMGTRGHTGLRRLLKGSVARKVQKAAPCPVVAVTPPLDGTEHLPGLLPKENNSPQASEFQSAVAQRRSSGAAVGVSSEQCGREGGFSFRSWHGAATAPRIMEG